MNDRVNFQWDDCEWLIEECENATATVSPCTLAAQPLLAKIVQLAYQAPINTINKTVPYILHQHSLLCEDQNCPDRSNLR